MRIDQVLHWLCLVKSRSQAARGCREGRILVGGERARPAREVHARDEITLRGLVAGRTRVVRIDQIPDHQQSRQAAATFYTVLREELSDPFGAPGAPTGRTAEE